MHSAEPIVLPSRSAAKTPRFDMYGLIHKALRRQMFDALQRVGSVDVDDEAEMGAVADTITSLLAQLRSHLEHEDEFLHAAIEARQPGGAAVTAGDHLEHHAAIAALEDELYNLRGTPPGHRAERVQRLYRHLALFVAENLQHMHIEETANNAALWALYSDEELHGIHDRLLAGIAPAEMMSVARWMSAAGNPQELAATFGEMQAKAPAPAFAAMLDIARSAMDDTRWAKLTRSLGLPPVPGLMTA